jgi:type I restriction enzyme R subunit
MTPEEKARIEIDSKLSDCGWVVQDHAHLNLSANRGVAVREFPLKRGHGTADYLLYVDRRVVGVIEAKKAGETLTGVEVQTAKYSTGLPEMLPAARRPLPFLYQSTGVETRFTNAMDADAASRDVFAFHRPETLAEVIGMAPRTNIAAPQRSYSPETLLQRLNDLPPIQAEGMRDCQVEDITKLEKSLAENRRRSLVQMQTGSGKTYTAVAQSYRLIKWGGAKRILFIVDRGNLGKQTLNEFQQYVTPDDGRKFTELYNVQLLTSNHIDPVAKVVITTIQRLYSILQGEPEFDESNEEGPITGLAALRKEALPVIYNPTLPIEFFDFVFTDECHRSIYNLWRQVLEYFDASLIGLTATPSKQTLGFFQQNLVMEYGHAQAVADKVNVDFSVYRIQTKITDQGATIDAGYRVDKRDRKSRRRRWEELDADLTYAPNQLDRAVVAEDQIRTVIRTFKEKLFTEIFPGRQMVPKTLIFAKDDSHADDIVRIVREEFAKGNDFCQKITYRTSSVQIVDPETGAITYKSSGIKPEDLLSSFRNAVNPRIAVTVDMIATGTDIKPLEIVFFMRDVQSSNYFEQMKGRGCRVMTPTEFQAVTSDGVNKSRYVIVDAVGVTEHAGKDSVPLEREPTVPLKSILQAVGAGSTDPAVISTLASRLSRLANIISPGALAGLEELAGKSLPELIKDLVDSVDPDAIEEACLAPFADGTIVDPTSPVQMAIHMREKAVEPFLNSELRHHILNAQQEAEQTIDTVTKDEVLFAGATAEATERARTTIESFAQYLADNRDEIEAISLLYNKRRGQAPTLRQLKELAKTLERPPRAWTPEALWRAYETLEESRVRGHGGKVVTDLVSLVRFALEQETILSPFAETVEDRFAGWMATQTASGRTFSPDQMRWLEMIRDHVKTSIVIDPEAFEYAPFIQQGGLGRAHQVFGDRLEPMLLELNAVLTT